MIYLWTICGSVFWILGVWAFEKAKRERRDIQRIQREYWRLHADDMAGLVRCLPSDCALYEQAARMQLEAELRAMGYKETTHHEQ